MADKPTHRSRREAPLWLIACASLFGGACFKGEEVPYSSGVPGMPDPMPGQAALAGAVRDGSGQPIAGATVKIAETDATTTTDPSGAYQLTVPSDSTLTLFAQAAGMATTYRDAVMLASGASLGGYDLDLVPAAQIDSMNALGPSGQTTGRGAVALRLHSMSAGCVLPGARVSVFPADAAMVVYSSPAAPGSALDMPDPGVTAVQSGTRIEAWLVSALPPGNMNLLQIQVQQNGCQLMDQSPSLNGLTFVGERRVAAESLTETDLFLH
jgi:hypothetical protein